MPVFPDFDRFFSISEWLNGRLSAFDNKFRIIGATDNTKQIAFEADGLTTATTRTFTFPDYDVTAGVAARRQVLVGADNLTLSEADSGAIIHCGAAEDFVLPALTSANVGLEYEFLVTTTATSLTITAATGDLLTGGVGMDSTTAGDGEAFSADGTDDLIISMNGTTTGGIVGSWVILTAAGATQWLVRGTLLGSGTMTTPFS